MSPPKGTQPQNHVVGTEKPSGNQTRNEPLPVLNCSKNSSTDIQNTEQHVVTTLDGDTTTPLLITATPLIEEGLVRDEQTNKVYLPIISTVVLKLKKEMFYMPLDFENNLTVDALVDSGAFVSAIAQDDLEAIKQKGPNNILKIDDPPNFQIQVANGQIEKPLTTARLKFEIGDNNFAEHFVVMKKVTGPIIGLHFMRNNSLVIDTTQASYISSTWRCKLKQPQVKQPQNHSQSSLTKPWPYHQRRQKQSQPSLIIRRNGTQQALWHRWRSLRKQQVCWFPTQCWQ